MAPAAMPMLLKPIEPAKLINTVARWSDARKTPSEPTATAASSGGLTRPKTLKILLIDDNDVTCKSMGMLLEMNGHEVRIAHTASRRWRLPKISRPM